MREGERRMSPFEPFDVAQGWQRKMLSAEGTCDLGHIPRVVLWRPGIASSLHTVTKYPRDIAMATAPHLMAIADDEIAYHRHWVSFLPFARNAK